MDHSTSVRSGVARVSSARRCPCGASRRTEVRRRAVIVAAQTTDALHSVERQRERRCASSSATSRRSSSWRAWNRGRAGRQEPTRSARRRRRGSRRARPCSRADAHRHHRLPHSVVDDTTAAPRAPPRRSGELPAGAFREYPDCVGRTLYGELAPGSSSASDQADSSSISGWGVISAARHRSSARDPSAHARR